MTHLETKRCVACEGGARPLNDTQIQPLLAQLSDWTLDPAKKQLMRSFQFKNFYSTMAFVNAVAWIAHQENHHPDMEVGYSSCTLRYSTHAIKGLSENDFICAAKVDQLIKTYSDSHSPS